MDKINRCELAPSSDTICQLCTVLMRLARDSKNQPTLRSIAELLVGAIEELGMVAERKHASDTLELILVRQAQALLRLIVPREPPRAHDRYLLLALHELAFAEFNLMPTESSLAAVRAAVEEKRRR